MAVTHDLPLMYSDRRLNSFKRSVLRHSTVIKMPNCVFFNKNNEILNETISGNITLLIW